MLQKNALWGLDGPGEAPPLETSSCRIGFSILWGPASWVPGLPRRGKFADEFSHLSPWGALQARSVAAVGRPHCAICKGSWLWIREYGVIWCNLQGILASETRILRNMQRIYRIGSAAIA